MTVVIEAIIFIISILGLALLLALLALVYKASNEDGLKKHRSKEEGLADLLNYASVVDDGVILNKNGSLMAAWLYKGEDSDSSTDTQKEIISAQINHALNGMGGGWMIHVDSVRRESSHYPQASLSAFPDSITANIDAERRRLFEGMGTTFEGYFVVTVTYYPPLLAQQKFVDLMFDDDTPAASNKENALSIIQQFKKNCLAFESSLSSCMDMTRLAGNEVKTEDGRVVVQDDFLAWLHFCVTGISQPITLGSTPMYLDSVIGGQELLGGVIPKMGQKFIQVVAIEGFPLESSPGILNALSKLPCEYRWSNRFIFMDSHEAIKHLDKYRKKWKQKVRGFFDQVFNTNTGHVDQDAADMVVDAESAIADVNSGLVSQGYYTSVIVLMNEDRKVLSDGTRLVQEQINRLGFVSRIETINTMDAFFGSLPGHGVENVRRPLINTLNLADLLPTSSIWTGHESAPCPMYPVAPALMHCITHGSTPFRLNTHVGDVGHTLMLGPTGAGKSTHLTLLAAQLRRYSGMTIFTFDKGMSFYPLTAAIHADTRGQSGKHFVVGGDGSRLAFSPLQFLETKSDRAWACEWIDTLLALNGVETSPTQRNEIAEAIESMYHSKSKTLSDFSLTVQDVEIREAIKQYTIDGAMGHLLDAEEDGLDFCDFTTFEIEELLNLGEKFTLPVLLYLFHRIEMSLKGQPAAIILDEAWIMLGTPVFREKIKEWLKVLRKANCSVIMATQNISDAANSGILDVIVESAPTKIFLPNPNASEEDSSALYRRMGLNQKQIDILSHMTPKREYYYVSPLGKRQYELGLGSYALAFVGAADKESIETIKALEKEYGYQWVNEWLVRNGLAQSNKKYKEVVTV